MPFDTKIRRGKESRGCRGGEKERKEERERADCRPIYDRSQLNNERLVLERNESRKSELGEKEHF